MKSAEGDWSEVRIAEVRIVVSKRDPVALVRRANSDDVLVSWADLDVGLRAISTIVVGASTGAWVFYRPDESDDAALPDGAPAALHIAPDGELTRFPRLAGHHLLGATAHGLWITGRDLPDVRDDQAWRKTQSVTVLEQSGPVREITVDGRIAFVLPGEEFSRVIFYTGAPEARTHKWGGGSTFVYSYQPVNIGAGLPEHVRVPAYATGKFDEEELVAAMEAAMPRPPDDWGCCTSRCHRIWRARSGPICGRCP